MCSVAENGLKAAPSPPILHYQIKAVWLPEQSEFEDTLRMPSVRFHLGEIHSYIGRQVKRQPGEWAAKPAHSTASPLRHTERLNCLTQFEDWKLSPLCVSSSIPKSERKV